MSWVRVRNVTKRFDSNVALREVDFTLTDGDRVGLIGRNGSGKSTLLELILGRDDPTEGTIEVTDGIDIGYFSQFSELSGDRSIWAILTDAFADVHETQERLDAIGAAMGDGPDADTMTALIDEQGELFERMEALDGWTYENRIDTVLSKLGFNEERRHLPLDALSGGWRNRAALARLLLQAPQILLLDEPTNYLDLDGVRWIENWLSSFRGAVLLVSHDRAFLDSVVTRIVEVEHHRLHEYDGDYSYYVNKRQSRLKTLERLFEHEEALLAYEQEAITDRREAARNPSRALEKRLAGIKKRKTSRPVDQVITTIYDDLHVSDDLCRVEDLSKSYGDHTLFEGLSFTLHRRDRLAIVGANGSGKSTLLDVLSGDTEPDSGRVTWIKGAGFISHNQVVERLDAADTVAHAVGAAPNSLAFSATKKSVNRFLTLLQFSEMDLKARIGTLSGGQRARVALAQCLLSGSSVIILDEPTNHLDITSAQVMERALTHFPGAVVVVSHDRFFIDKLADRLLVFDGAGGVSIGTGTGALVG